VGRRFSHAQPLQSSCKTAIFCRATLHSWYFSARLAGGSPSELKRRHVRQVAALVANDFWKLERLDKIKQALVLGRIEQFLTQTPVGEQAATNDVYRHFGGALPLWIREPSPTRW
jgi:hypothetical protein